MGANAQLFLTIWQRGASTRDDLSLPAAPLGSFSAELAGSGLARYFQRQAFVGNGMTVLVGAAAMVALGTAIALVAGAGKARRALAVLLGASSLAVTSWLPSELVFARGAFALWNILLVLRAIDLATEQRSSPLSVRLALMFVVFDARKVQPCVARLDGRLLLHGLVFALLAALGLAGVLWGAPRVSGPAGSLFAWASGLLYVYTSIDAAARLTVAVHQARGVAVPPQHDNPILSRSVAEFWSRRWNLNVSAWLREHVFSPLAQRGHARWGLAAAFVVSALLHWWLIHVALGWAWSLPMASFFVLQAVFIRLERALRIRRLAPWLQHGWTVSVMLLTSPLFVAPFMELFVSLV